MPSNLQSGTVEDLLRYYDIPFRYPQDVPKGTLAPTWDGTVLTLDWDVKDSTKFEHKEWVLHEISHHLFAKPEARVLPNYGLGTDPGGGDDSEAIPSSWRFSCPVLDEELVCILDLVLMVRHGFSAQEIRAHMRHYNIPEPGIDEIRKLIKIGFAQEEFLAAHTELILLPDEDSNDE